MEVRECQREKFSDLSGKVRGCQDIFENVLEVFQNDREIYQGLWKLEVSLIIFYSQPHFGTELLSFIQFYHFPTFSSDWQLTFTHSSQYLIYIPGFQLSRPTLKSGISWWVENVLIKINRVGKRRKWTFLSKSMQGVG